jgi:hypothetical protein
VYHKTYPSAAATELQIKSAFGVIKNRSFQLAGQNAGQPAGRASDDSIS